MFGILAGGSRAEQMLPFLGMTCAYIDWWNGKNGHTCYTNVL